MTHYGDFASGSTVYMVYDSFAAATGASSATSNFAAADIICFKDGSATERTSANGITVTTSFNSSTGLQMVAIDLSDNTDSGFWATGHEYQIAVADITIDTQTVRFWLGTFSIERANGVLAKLIAGTAKVDVTKWLTGTIPAVNTTGVPLVDLVRINGTSVAGTSTRVADSFTSFFNVASATGTVNSLPAAIPGASTGLLISGSNAGTTTFGALTVTGATTLTGAVSLGSTLGVTGTTTLAAVNTAAILTGNIGVVGTLTVSGTTQFAAVTTTGLVTFNAFTVTGATTLSGAVSMNGTFGVAGTTTLAALTVTNATTLSGAVSLGSTLGVTGTTTLAALTTTGTVTFNAFTVSGATTLTGTVSATGASNDIRGIQWKDATAAGLAKLFSVDTTTTYASAVAGSVVKEIADNAGGSALSEAGIAAAVWDLDATAHQTQGTFGQAIGDPGAGTATIWSKTNALPSDPADASDIAAAFSTVNSTLATIAGYVDTEVGTIVTNLNSLITTVGVAGAGLTAADDAVIAAIAALTIPTAAQNATAVLTTQMTESYAADGTAPTLAQAIFLTQQSLHEFAINSTTRTIYKLNGTTPAATFTLDSATSPTSTTRAS